MFKRAQDMLQMMQDGVRNTRRVVADLAESVGVPPAVTSLIQPANGAQEEWAATYQPPAPTPDPVVAKAPDPAPAPVAAKAEETAAEPPKAKPRPAAKRRQLMGDKERSKGVRPLEVDDAINGSTYLARIIWSLGVANLEGIGPLRPADIARMVMSRSAVSLEPPNVARYIRRSKPKSIGVDHIEGGSNYYKLNAAGKKLFEEYFVA